MLFERFVIIAVDSAGTPIALGRVVALLRQFSEHRLGHRGIARHLFLMDALRFEGTDNLSQRRRPLRPGLNSRYRIGHVLDDRRRILHQVHSNLFHKHLRVVVVVAPVG